VRPNKVAEKRVGYREKMSLEHINQLQYDITALNSSNRNVCGCSSFSYVLLGIPACSILLRRSSRFFGLGFRITQFRFDGADLLTEEIFTLTLGHLVARLRADARLHGEDF
jgi:hypothetical protein